MKQPIVAHSSTKAKYMYQASLTSELLWLKQLLKNFEIKSPSMVFCDIISTIYLASNPTTHDISKHIDIDYHFIRERVVESRLIKLNHVSSRHQLTYPYSILLSLNYPIPHFKLVG